MSATYATIHVGSSAIAVAMSSTPASNDSVFGEVG
jgi:hypothetical protein